ncbi:DUF4349 domain-containing protein [Chloroflexota bacterium]
MKRLMVIMGLLLVVGLLSVSCSGARSTSESVAWEKGMEVPAPMSPVEETPPRESIIGEGLADATSLATKRMIVRNGDMSLVVESVVDTRDEIGRLAVRLDGYVVSSWTSGEEEKMRASIQIRVPDEKFEQTLVELRKLAVRVDSEGTNSQDVTEEYTDLAARLKNAEATEAQYLVLLDKAEDVEDIIRVYDSLNRVQREIEQIKGRIQYLERTSSMSLITVQLRPAATAKPLVPVEWSALETLKSAIRGIVIFGQWLVTIGIWLLLLLPVWGTVLGVIYWRRRRGKEAQ